MTLRAMVTLAATLMLPVSGFAGFDWGTGVCGGSGSFEQAVKKNDVVEIGEIPVGKGGVFIRLQADGDIDIQLFDKQSGDKLVQWPDGLLNGADEASVTYGDVTVTYSGYNGDGSGLGNEYIRVDGMTDRELAMKAYGYAAGQATVDYSWSTSAGCNTAPAAAGSGNFQQSIAKDAVVTVGDLVSGLENVYVSLISDNDVDVQLVDTASDTKIVHWPSGLLNGPGTNAVSYGGVTIEYSGYHGDGTGLGHEYIKITGTIDRTYRLSAYGYAAGDATVDYSWGASSSSSVSSSSSLSSSSVSSSSSSSDDTWAAYYASAEGLTGSALKAALHDIIDGHSMLSYSEVWEALKDTDEDPDDTSSVILLYKQTPQSKTTNGGNVDDWNREHVWAKSHGDFGTAIGPGTDVHHLRPTDVTVNGARGNKDFDNGGSVVSEAPLCNTDSDSWEAPNVVKGDVARMMFYMATRYEGDDGYPDLELVDYMTTGTSSPVHGILSTLLQWHQQDPVSDFERRRNDRIYNNWQGNRNPFIDHPEYVELIWN